MDHVVVCVHPFVMRQEISVFQNGECVKHIECDLNELDKIAYDLCKEYNIHQLDYAGAKDYGLKLEEKINLYKYGNFAIQFNYY